MMRWTHTFSPCECRDFNSGTVSKSHIQTCHRKAQQHAYATASADLPVFVYQCIEGHAVPPARGEVVNVDIWVPANDRAQDKATELPNMGLCFR